MAESENTDTIDTLEETSITMVDILAHENELEEEYAAVLGASDDKCCTYSKGPIKRQALYSCLTCCPDSVNDLDKCAGICLACSLHCHENHELVELYTKRNFRCDCPTERFPEVKCTLNADAPVVDGNKKLPKNESNLYNQNFQGVYCTCKRPYPDPESPVEEVMLQCAICEDWYHLHHLGLKVKKLRDDYYEMVCPGCMQKHEFLQDYIGLALTRLEDLEESNVLVAESDDKLKSDLDKSISEIMNMSGEEGVENNDAGTSEMSGKTEDDSEPAAKRQKTDEPSGCRRPKKKPEWNKNIATLWLSDWRAALCKCKECLPLYETFKITFLLDPEDSASHYEERGRKVAKESSYEQGIRALSSIGRTQQIDAITEYNKMKDKLKDFLHTFVVNKKVVTEEDINRFFQEMKNEKNANLGQPFFCR